MHSFFQVDHLLKCMIFSILLTLFNGDYMKVKDIMTRDIVVGSINDSLKDVSLLMLNYDIGFLPIKNKKKIVGVLTDRDLVINGIINNSAISDIMNRTLITINYNSSIKSCIDTMKKYRVRRLLVVDEKKIVGIISISDIVNNYNKSKRIIGLLKNILIIDKNCDDTLLSVKDFLL